MRDAPSGDRLGHLHAAAVRLTSSRLARSFAVLMSGTAIAQVAALAASPALARIFDPEAFGLLGVFMSLTALLGTFAPLAFSLAIVVPAEERVAGDLAVLAGIATLSTTALVTVVVVFARDMIAVALNAPGLATILLWLPLAVLADGTYRTLTYVSLRARCERRVSNARIVHSVSSSALQIAFGLAGSMRHGLALGYVMGHSLAAATLLLSAWRDRTLPSLRATSRTSIMATARRYAAFPLYKLPSQLLGVASSVVTIIALAALFPSAVVGLYALTRRVVRGPAELVGTTLADAFFARFGDRWRHDRRGARLLWRRTTLVLVAVVVPAALLFATVAPPVFAWLFGEAWREAGTYARWLSVYIASTTIARPAMMSLSITGHQRAELAFGTSRLVLMASTLVVAAPAGPTVAIAAHAVVGALLQACLVAYTAVVIDRSAPGRTESPG